MPETEKQTAIEAQNVVRKFAGQYAVNSVSFEVKQGEFVSLLGPSGCGKTTLLRMLGGLDRPDEGAILLAGRDVTKIPAYGRDSNMIFQQLALFPHMDVYKNIAYGLRMKGRGKAEIRAKVERALELVQLSGYGGRSIAQLSGGQAQRVAIARALVNEPKVLLLDEPLSALDAQLRVDMQRELKRIQRESGTTFIFVTHDQKEALNVSDRIGVMRGGRLLQYGTPDDIYERPADSFVAKFIGDTNLLPASLVSLGGDTASVRAAGALSRVHVGPGGTAIAAGALGYVSIRYEYVRVGEAAAQLGNTMNAIVENVRYGGTFLQYELRLDGEHRLTASMPHYPGNRRYEPGEAVLIGWEPKDAILLPGDGEGEA